MDKETFEALSETEKIQLYYDTLGQDTDEAKWSTAFINNLPDISFAAIAPGGKKDDEGKTVPRTKRHLPHHGNISTHTTTNVDKPHLENAASRVNQISDKGLIPKAKGHLRAHYKALKWEIPPNLEEKEAEPIEDITYSKLHIVEDKELSESTDGYLRGYLLGSIAEKKNANKRLYPRTVWENNISRIVELMTRGRFVGHVNHPYRGLFGGSGGVEDMVLKFEDVWFGDVDGPNGKSNELWLETIIIPTQKGKDVAEILKAGVELGVSSRGWGTSTPVYKPRENEEDEPVLDYYRVNDDYQVEAFDLVYAPAEDEARVYKLEHMEDEPMDTEEVRERYPELVSHIEVSVSEPLKAKIAEIEEQIETGMAIQNEQAEKIGELEAEIEAKQGELDSARAEIESLQNAYEIGELECHNLKVLIETHEAELVELRPFRPKFEALTYLLEKAKGETMAWMLVEALKECATPEEIDEKFEEAKGNAEALLYAEDFLGRKGGRAKYGPALSDAETDEQYEEQRKQWNRQRKRLACDS